MYLLGSSGGCGGAYVCCVGMCPKELGSTTLLPVGPVVGIEELVDDTTVGAENMTIL